MLCPRHQALKTAQPRKVFLHIQPVCRGCGGKRIDDRAGLSTFGGMGEQPVFTSYHERSDGVLGAVVIHWDVSVLKAAVKIGPFIQAILNCPGKLVSTAYGKAFQPCEKSVKNRFQPFLPLVVPLICGERLFYLCSALILALKFPFEQKYLIAKLYPPLAAALFASSALSVGNASANFLRACAQQPQRIASVSLL